jgi:hypothetical protein
MPPPLFIPLNKTYRVEYVNGDIDTYAQQIAQHEANIRSYNGQIAELQQQIRDLQVLIIQSYISTTGTLPP